MTTRLMKRFSILPLLLLSLNFCQADPPPAFLSIPFGAEAPVYDLNGEHTFVQSLIGPGGVESAFFFSLPLTHHADGRVTGSGITIVGLGETQGFAAIFRASGRVVTTSYGATRLLLAVRLTGQDYILGVNSKFNITLNYRMDVVPEEQLMRGTVRGKANFSNLGKAVILSDIDVPLYAAGDGSWSLNLETLTLQRVVGVGSINISSGRVLTARAVGAYYPISDVSVLKVFSTGETRGSIFAIKFDTFEGESRPLALRGRLLGQRLVYRFTEPEPEE